MVKKNTSNKSYSRAKKVPENYTHHLKAWLFGLALMTVLAVGVPVMLWAQSNDAPHRVNVDAGALSQLQTKLDELQKSLDSLVATKTEIIGGSQDFGAKLDDARSDCLNQCRTQRVICFDEYDGDVAPGVSHPCLAKTSACVTACNDTPRSPVSCQDRCAVALGGCVEGVIAPKSTVVEDEETALDGCRTQNRECLLDECKISDESAMPDSYCMDQCRRLSVICTTGSAQYDVNAMELCKRIEQTCTQRLCMGAKFYYDGN